MAYEHILTESDTLMSIALTYLGDETRWKEIAEYNRLDQPYIVSDIDDSSDGFGRGYLTVQRTSNAKDLHITKGWTFNTLPALLTGAIKCFTVEEDAVLSAGESIGYVYVKSALRGSLGNVPAYTVFTSGKAFVDANIDFGSIINESDFTGGRDTRVLTIGDTIYIPSEVLEYILPDTINQLTELTGGEDLALSPASGFERAIVEDGYGDLATVSGLDNIIQAINDRLMTEKGELPLHPTYGTDIQLFIGSARKPYTAKMVELEIYDALSYEDRIRDVKVDRLTIEGTTVDVELSFKPASIDREVTVNLSLVYGRGKGGIAYV